MGINIGTTGWFPGINYFCSFLDPVELCVSGCFPPRSADEA